MLVISYEKPQTFIPEEIASPIMKFFGLRTPKISNSKKDISKSLKGYQCSGNNFQDMETELSVVAKRTA